MIVPDDALDIRALLGEEAANAPRPVGMSARNLRRAKVRRTTVLAASLAAIAVVGTVFVFGAAWVLGEDFNERDPIDPVPTPEATAAGRQITFSRFASDGGIMVMNVDGSAIRSVVSQAHFALDKPAWAPNGFKIAFHGFFGAAENEGGGLFLINPDGTDRSLMFLGGNAPAWSIDSTTIAYTQEGRIHIVSMGRNPRPESTLDIEGDYPSWSPDGLKLVFSRGGGGLWTVNRDGSELRLLLEDTPDSRPIDPDWSPDGSQIAFTSYADDGSETIEIISVDGIGRRTVTEGRAPAWSPDGTRIALSRADSDDTSHIYSIRPDGTDLRQLTFGPHADHSPDWVAVSSDLTSFPCPELMPPADNAREEMRTTIEDYLESRRPNGRGYSYRIERLTVPQEGGPEAACSAETWRRSFQVEGHFKPPKGATNPSSSLAYFRVLIGLSQDGWIVWAEPH